MYRKIAMSRTSAAAAIAAAVAGLALTGVTSDVAAADYYEGKTVTVIIGRPAGSGNDLAVRSFMNYWTNYIPGKPTMVAKNVAGGGGKVAFNQIYERSAPDGLTLVFQPYDPIPQILGDKGLKADFTKMPFVGGLQNPSLTYVSAEVAKKREEIVKAKGVLYGGQRPHNRFDLFGRMGFDMLGVDYRYSTGFPGSVKVFQAPQRGEIQVQTVGYNVYQRHAAPKMVETGKATPLWYHPSVTLDGKFVDMKSTFGDIPSFPTVYKQIKGSEPSGELFGLYKWMLAAVNGMSYSVFLPPGTPDNVVGILRTSFDKVTKDHGYLADERKMFDFNLPVIDSKTGSGFVTMINTVSPERVKYLAAYIDKVKEKKQ